MDSEKRQLDLGVEYGMSARCCATLEPETASGQTARQLISRVSSTEQETKPARRAARVIRDVILSGRRVDVSVVKGSKEKLEAGKPVGLDQVILKSNGGQIETDQLTLRVREPYVGGIQEIL